MIRSGDTVFLGPDTAIGVSELSAVAHGRAKPVLTSRAEVAVEAAHRLVGRLIAQRRIVYGITTGFGPLAGTYVDPSRSEELQRNLLSHLRSGVGPALPKIQVRAMMTARAASLARGHSGISPESLRLLIDMVNRDVVPLVPEMGTVGASGDLTPLAHMAAVLVGEGEARFRDTPMPAADALAAAGLRPVTLGPKEAIALVNGTSAMTGIAALAGHDFDSLLDLAVRSALLYAELFQARFEAFDRRLGEVRPHPGQKRVHERFTDLSSDGARLRFEPSTTGRLPTGGAETGVFANGHIIQDPYSIRCVPQLYGAAFDVLEYHRRTVETEISSVTDNPILIPDEDAVLHGGNFFGQHVAFVSDSLTNAVIAVAAHVERTVDRITDPLRSAGLPPMLQPREPGLQSGFMGAGVTATALVAEMRTRAMPASIQSISTNAANQDIVTMGTIAARNSAWQVARLRDLVAIQLLVLAQAAELRAGRLGLEAAGFSSSSRDLVAMVRRVAPPLEDDRALSEDIARLAASLGEGVGESR